MFRSLTHDNTRKEFNKVRAPGGVGTPRRRVEQKEGLQEMPRQRSSLKCTGTSISTEPASTLLFHDSAIGWIMVV